MEGASCDVAIAGGGPAGTSLAFQLASRGIDVHLFEEHSSLGSPSHCAGLVGPGMEEVPVIGQIVRDCTINKLKGAVFTSPGGGHFEVEGERGSALVIDRKVFDRRIAELAVREGAKIHLRSKVVGIGDGSVTVEGEGSRRCLSSRVMVGATGSRFSIASLMGDRSGNLIPGIQFEVTNLELDPELAYIYFGKEFSDGLFGWVIPLDSSTARIGLCSRKGAKAGLTKLLETKVWRDFGRGEIVEINAGAVVYGIRRRTAWHNTILLGDEALQTKPATGGGIHYSLICSRIASESIADHLNNGVDLFGYEATWRKELEKEIRFGLIVRRIYDELSDEEMDVLFGAVSEGIRRSLESADFDRHTSVRRALPMFLPIIIRELGLKRSMGLTLRLVFP